MISWKDILWIQHQKMSVKENSVVSYRIFSSKDLPAEWRWIGGRRYIIFFRIFKIFLKASAFWWESSPRLGEDPWRRWFCLQSLCGRLTNYYKHCCVLIWIKMVMMMCASSPSFVVKIREILHNVTIFLYNDNFFL